jgi:hypothetical protein
MVLDGRTEVIARGHLRTPTLREYLGVVFGFQDAKISANPETIADITTGPGEFTDNFWLRTNGSLIDFEGAEVRIVKDNEADRYELVSFRRKTQIAIPDGRSTRVFRIPQETLIELFDYKKELPLGLKDANLHFPLRDTLTPVVFGMFQRQHYISARNLPAVSRGVRYDPG